MPLALPAALTLGALLGIASWHDLKSRRIPNTLVLVGMTVGIIVSGHRC